MAGEWLKMECSTPDKPEVFAITAKMGWDDPDLVVGKLFRVWRWFDQQTVNGNAAGVTSALLDRIAGASGFAQAMIDVGWMVANEAGLTLPNFDKHNGATAKGRAQGAKRVANYRTDALGNAECNAPTVTEALPREEKRREEKNKEQSQKQKHSAPPPASDFFDGIDPQVVTDFKAMRAKHRAPVTPTVAAAFRREAAKAGMGLEAVLTLCCVRNWRGFQADWVTQPARASPGHQSAAEKSRDIANALTRRDRNARPDANIIDINSLPTSAFA